MPGKVMLSRKSEPLNPGTLPEASSTYFNRSFSDNDRDDDEPNESSFEVIYSVSFFPKKGF